MSRFNHDYWVDLGMEDAMKGDEPQYPGIPSYMSGYASGLKLKTKKESQS